MKQVWRVLAVLGMGLVVQFSAVAGEVVLDDLLPWPWGSECPFPWSRIEGEWTTRGSLTPERFSFTNKGELENGSRVLDVKRFDFEGELIGVGEGISPRGERIVRAGMVGVGPDKGKTYWALVRTYRELEKKSCSRTKQVTVITLRSASHDGEKETHFIVDKEDGVRRKRH